MATPETFGDDTAATTETKRKGRAPITYNGVAVSPKAWKPLILSGSLAEDYKAYHALGRKIKERLSKGLTAKHIPAEHAAKHGVMMSLKNPDRPSYVLCDKAALAEAETFTG